MHHPAVTLWSESDRGGFLTRGEWREAQDCLQNKVPNALMAISSG